MTNLDPLGQLVKEIARTWKEGGGDAVGFYWCQGRILEEICKLEMPAEPQSETRK